MHLLSLRRLRSYGDSRCVNRGDAVDGPKHSFDDVDVAPQIEPARWVARSHGLRQVPRGACRQDILSSPWDEMTTDAADDQCS